MKKSPTKPVEINPQLRTLDKFHNQIGYNHDSLLSPMFHRSFLHNGSDSMSRHFNATLLSSLAIALATTASLGLGQDKPNPVHQSENAIGQFEIHPELDVELFAAEPLMANPSNIDVDHLGRVWVCEVINYRHFRNSDAKLREAGDRILILEDTDGDAVADHSTTFYQGRDIDSAHGICVLGDRAIVSANDSVFILTDTDGDLKADKKEILFTGISGTQHDHGIHAFVFGPDGKLYFNFGNAGKQIKDKDGQPIIDLAGNVVADHRKPYNQGMIFRCNLDGSEFETLAWNFRNNWEVCVDSFGTLWQSDNDDDGNRATRINYVMPFGNYGYTDQVTGSNWRTPRTGMHSDIPVQHWYQNDPGVIPNLLVTGAGSPTGICLYEGDTLPAVFQNQMIHCDAGPSIVRAYPVKKSGAGYTATIVNVMDGATGNNWFRPSDVCVAPDGSLIVADWYDPGVGGHRMQDIERGRLFRVSKKGGAGHYKAPAVDFSTQESAAQALRSPNQATRFLAWQALERFGPAAIEPLKKMWNDKNPRMRARALWMAGKLLIPKTEKLKFIHAGLTDKNPDIRVTAIRLCVQLRDELTGEDIQSQIGLETAPPEVLREILLGIRQWPGEHHGPIWAAIADKYQPGDRWMLEALGIAADGKWDECLAAWAGNSPAKLMTPAGQDIVWRSRGTDAADLLAQAIKDPKTNAQKSARYFRAFDFVTSARKSQALAELAFGENEFDPEKMSYVRIESAGRLDLKSLTPEQKEKLHATIDQSRGTPQFIQFVNKFSSESHYPDLLKIIESGIDRQMSADAAGVLLDKQQHGELGRAIIEAEAETRTKLCDALINSGKRPADQLLARLARRENLDSELRTYVVSRLGESRAGARDMLQWIEKSEAIDGVILPAIKAALHRARWPEIKTKADQLFPISATKDNRPLPPMDNLAKRTGDVVRGKTVFEGVGTCAKCHVVAGKGIEVGPDLSEIGNKLSKIAMYESILFPSAGISHNYENWMVLKDDGQMITGVLLGETDDDVQLKDEKGIKHVIPTVEIDEKKRQKLSLMPADLHKEMSVQELVDLVEYMAELKKK
ncbi:MAG: putative membrane-bound dehydrogenase-like protein [Mariniblastus sp.]